MRQIYRITESDLHRIIAESVNTVLNEVGETEDGQYLLGRLAGRKASKGDYHGFSSTEDYAKEKNKTNLKLKDKFARGFHFQKDKEKDE
jgi:hypothetical protein